MKFYSQQDTSQSFTEVNKRKSFISPHEHFSSYQHATFFVKFSLKIMPCLVHPLPTVCVSITPGVVCNIGFRSYTGTASRPIEIVFFCESLFLAAMSLGIFSIEFHILETVGVRHF